MNLIPQCVIFTTAEEWGKLTFQLHGPIQICQNQSQNVETVTLRWFHDGELKAVTLQFMNIVHCMLVQLFHCWSDLQK